MEEIVSMIDYIDEVKERVNLKEGRSVLIKILSIIYLEGSISTKEVARKSILPIPVVTAIKKEFINLKILEQNKGIQLTTIGKTYVENECGFLGLDTALYKLLLNEEDYRLQLMKELSSEYAHIYDNRPQVDVTIDQAKGTAETGFKRALLCLEKQSLIGKRILCVGDDDLISVAIGLLLKKLYSDTKVIKYKICVFDIDARYVEYINLVAKEYEIPVECFKVNLKEPLPIYFANSFDCFFTDPPYTNDGMSLFLSRGISALKKERGLNIFLSYGQKPIQETLHLEQTILMHGVVIADIYKSFNRYEGASLLGNVSQMIILETTDDMNMVIPDTEKYMNKIYTGELRDNVSIYECKNCKSTFTLGRNGKFKTIEQLKKNGCPNCMQNTFILKKKKLVQKEAVVKKKKALGEHILADFFVCCSEVLKDDNLIKKYMHEAAKKANATIVAEEFHKFNPWGVSGAIIIKESHLTIHTWPEYQYAAVDLFTCGDSLDLWSAFEYLKEKLKCEKVEYNDIFRGLLRADKVNYHKEFGVDNYCIRS